VETAKSRLGPVAQDIDLDEPKLNLSSRSKHFDESLQETISRVEKEISLHVPLEVTKAA
jgi:hypothetical protein